MGIQIFEDKKRFSRFRERHLRGFRPKEDMDTNTETQLELKYCERCGCLGLRPRTSAQIYCRKCAGAMSQVAQNRKQSPSPGKKPCVSVVTAAAGSGRLA